MDTRSTPPTVSTQTQPIDAIFGQYVAAIKKRDAARAAADNLKKLMNKEWVKYYAANKEVDSLNTQLGLDDHPPFHDEESSGDEVAAPKKTKRRLIYSKE